MTEENQNPIYTVYGDDEHGYAIMQYGVLMPDERYRSLQTAQEAAYFLNDEDES